MPGERGAGPQDFDQMADAASAVGAGTGAEQTPVWPLESTQAKSDVLASPGRSRLEQRLDDLERAIAAHPEDPTAFVLRGELYFEVGEYDLAECDFETAQKLAASQFAVDNWGVISQTMQDRALVGLARARRRIGKRK